MVRGWGEGVVGELLIDDAVLAGQKGPWWNATAAQEQ